MAHTTVYTLHQLKELWTMLFQSEPPDDSQWALWFLLHDPDTVREAIVQLAAKRRKLDGQMDAVYMLKFASAVMSRLSHEQRTYATQRVPATGSTSRTHHQVKGGPTPRKGENDTITIQQRLQSSLGDDRRPEHHALRD